MTIIRMTANPSGAYPSPQDWFDEDIPDGFAAIPPEIDLRGFFDAQGFVIPTFVAKSLTGYTVNQEALDAWHARERKIYLQTMPISAFAGAISSVLPTKG